MDLKLLLRTEHICVPESLLTRGPGSITAYVTAPSDSWAGLTGHCPPAWILQNCRVGKTEANLSTGKASGEIRMEHEA